MVENIGKVLHNKCLVSTFQFENDASVYKEPKFAFWHVDFQEQPCTLWDAFG